MTTATRNYLRHSTSKEAKDWLVVNDRIRIPSWVTDFKSFRKWSQSTEYPEYGDVFWIGGTIWVDTELEDLPTHNLVKTAVLLTLGWLLKDSKAGYLIQDGMRLANEEVSLSVEPDVMYVSRKSVAEGKTRISRNRKHRILEVNSSPEMVLEVASDSSKKKDDDLLKDYFKAGIEEYWRIDARGDEVKFEIFRRGATGFVANPRRNGFIHSHVFGKAFKLNVSEDDLGIPSFSLEISE